MDYTVGSLADLISGQNTPNKPKVKKIKLETHEDIKKSVITEKKKKKIKKEVPNAELEPLEENGQIIKSKKRKYKDITEKVEKKIKQKASNDELEPLEKNMQIMKSEKRKIKDGPSKNAKKHKIKDVPSQNARKHETGLNSLADSDEETSINAADNLDALPVDEQNKDVKIKKEKIVQTPEELARTVFVGNVPINTQKKKMKQLFKKYGPIESVRFRGIPVADPKVPKKIAAITKKYHPDRHSVYSYVRFVDKEDAEKALIENGVLFQDHHLSVRPCGNTNDNPDESKAIFIGNLSFNAEEEELWKLFESCGPISHIRIIRDSYTGMGKGFAYVNFKDSDGVQLALEMENVKLGNRELRIRPSSVSSAKKNKKNKSLKVNTNPQWRKKHTEKHENDSGKSNEYKSTFEKPNNIQNKNFQGSKFNIKKKNKVNKGLMQKKQNVKNIAPNF